MRDNPNTMTAAINSTRQEFALQQDFSCALVVTILLHKAFVANRWKLIIIDQNEINSLSAGLSLHLDLSIKRSRQSKCDTTKKSFVWNCLKKGHISAQCPRNQIAAIEAQDNETMQELNYHAPSKLGPLGVAKKENHLNCPL